MDEYLVIFDNKTFEYYKVDSFIELVNIIQEYCEAYNVSVSKLEKI